MKKKLYMVIECVNLIDLLAILSCKCSLTPLCIAQIRLLRFQIFLLTIKISHWDIRDDAFSVKKLERVLSKIYQT